MSGLIPKQFIVDLIDRADVVEVVGRHVQLKKAGKEFKACCPFHDEKTPSFTVSPAKGFYHCFGCGAHGNALDFLMEYDHMDFVEAVESLARSMGIEVPREETQRPARSYDALFELVASVSAFYRDQLKSHQPAVEYLKARGIDGATARRFGIGYAPAGWSNVLDHFGQSSESAERLFAAGLVIRKDNGGFYDRFRDRIMFPIRDTRGRTIGFGGRVMGDGEPKYLNSPETVLFHKGRELYGLYEARQALRSIDRLVVVEGYMDVVGLARHGIDFATGTLGTATTDEHLNRLFRLCDDVYFCFDGDRAGRAAAWKALEVALPRIREGRQVRFVFLPEGQDPDSFVQARGADAFVAATDRAVPLSDFLIEELSGQVDMDSVDGRARLAEMAKPLVSRIPPGVYRTLLVDRLAETVGIAAARLESILDRPAARSGKGTRPPTTRLRPRASSGHAGKPSLVRRAITLIVHYPAAAENIDIEKLAGVAKPGIDLLHDLVETVQSQPNISTAGLLERFRNDKEGQHLGKLVGVELPGSDEFDAGAELAACISQLALAARRKRIDLLIEKQKLGELSVSERDELRELTRGSGTDG
jgi:DNA primase